MAGIPYSDMLVVAGRTNQVRHQCYIEQRPVLNDFVYIYLNKKK